MVSALLKILSRYLPGRRIDGDDGRPYLERYYLGGAFGRCVYLHRFVASDPDRGVHDHPWRRAVSVVLTGGYRELRLRRDRGSTVTRRVRPLSVNVIRGDDFHRVLLDQPEAWTLFVHGPRIKGWGFLRGGQYVPYARDATDFRHENWWEKTPRGEFWVDRPRRPGDSGTRLTSVEGRVLPGQAGPGNRDEAVTAELPTGPD